MVVVRAWTGRRRSACDERQRPVRRSSCRSASRAARRRSRSVSARPWPRRRRRPAPVHCPSETPTVRCPTRGRAWTALDVILGRRPAHTTNKMHSETADFTSSAATWRSGPNNVAWLPTGTVTWRTRRACQRLNQSDAVGTRKHRQSLILAYFLHYMKTWRHPQNRKYISHRRQRRTEPQPQKIWWNLGCAFCYM